MSVIIGVIHMTFGLCLSFFNYWYVIMFSIFVHLFFCSRPCFPVPDFPRCYCFLQALWSDKKCVLCADPWADLHDVSIWLPGVHVGIQVDCLHPCPVWIRSQYTYPLHRHVPLQKQPSKPTALYRTGVCGLLISRKGTCYCFNSCSRGILLILFVFFEHDNIHFMLFGRSLSNKYFTNPYTH